ncbi:hypothetical protein [Natronospira bacteriovora]|uniref:Fibronectin type-III domain-containing protein n=1 Tax=Natronospira bacteriovora TaxID=3069753 RepID=A0ABU0W883_9GAMM|nr:hypothetical protein [Natronospira sp. AB-CW4]MDQ2070233.1 hypothetical protein [Natronospira sp. AB-CW4]
MEKLYPENLLRLLAALILSLAVAVILPACGGSSSSDDSDAGENGDDDDNGDDNGDDDDDDDGFAVGGNLSGLSGGTLELLLNDDDLLALSDNGAFSFETTLDDGDSYEVTVDSHPDGQQCQIDNASGVIDGEDVDDVEVSCSAEAVAHAWAEPRNQAVEVDWDAAGGASYSLVWSTDPDMDPENYSAHDGSGSASDIEPPYRVEELDNDQRYYFALEEDGAGFGPVFGSRPMAPVTDMWARAVMFDQDDNLFFGGSMTAGARMSGGFVALEREHYTPLPTAKVGGRVRAMVSDGEDGYFLAGDFDYIDGEERQMLARVDEDGRLDSDWQVDIDGWMVSELLFHDDRLYVRGSFTAINGANVDGIAKLNRQGDVLAWELDHDASINRMTMHDGEIYAVTTLEMTAGDEEEGVARFADDGSFLGWVAQIDPDETISHMTVAEDGAVYMAGNFTEVDGEPRDGFARIDENGDLSALMIDHGFNWVGALLVTDDAIYLGESPFPSLSTPLKAFDRDTGDELNWPEAQPNYGNLGWSVGVSNIQEIDGNILVTGLFRYIGGERQKNYALFSPEGTLLDGPELRLPRGASRVIVEDDRLLFATTGTVWDLQDPRGIGTLDMAGEFRDWGPGMGSTVTAFAETHDYIYVGSLGERTAEGIRVDGVARFDRLTGAFDLGWQPDLELEDGSSLPNPRVTRLHALGDAIVMGGSFAEVNGTNRNGFVALDAGGNVLADFPDPEGGSIGTMDGSDDVLYVGGDFDTLDGQSRDYIAAIDADGNVTSWSPELDGSVRHISYHDGIIYVAGNFDTANSTPRDGFAAFNTDGVLQPWNPSSDLDAQFGLGATSLGVFIAGDFLEVDGQERDGIALVDKDSGAVNEDFELLAGPGANLVPVADVAERSDGVVCMVVSNWVGQTADYYDGQTRQGLICIDQDLSLYW